MLHAQLYSALRRHDDEYLARVSYSNYVPRRTGIYARLGGV